VKEVSGVAIDLHNVFLRRWLPSLPRT